MLRAMIWLLLTAAAFFVLLYGIGAQASLSPCGLPCAIANLNPIALVPKGASALWEWIGKNELGKGFFFLFLQSIMIIVLYGALVPTKHDRSNVREPVRLASGEARKIPSYEFNADMQSPPAAMQPRGVIADLNERIFTD